MALRDEVLLKQYESLRQEMAQKIQALESLATYGIAATAAVWPWILAHHADVQVEVVYFVPALASFLFVLKTHALRDAIIRISAHLAAIEGEASLTTTLAWDRTCTVNRKAGKTDFLDRWERMYWWGLTAINLAAPFILKLIKLGGCRC